MKKLFIILTVFSLLTLTLTAQEAGQVKVGFIAGLNYAIPVGNDMKDLIEEFDDVDDLTEDLWGGDADTEFKARLGFHAGLSLDYFFIDNFALVSGLSYSQKGFRVLRDWDYNISTIDNWDNPVLLNYNGESKWITRLDYLDLPITFKYHNDGGFMIFGGLLLSFLVFEEVYEEYEYNWQEYDYYNNYTQTLTDEEDGDDEDFEDFWHGDDPIATLAGFQFGIGYGDDKLNIAFKLNKTGNFGEIDWWGTGDEDDNKNLTLQLSTCIYF